MTTRIDERGTEDGRHATDERKKTEIHGAGSASLQETAQRLRERATTLRALLNGGVADRSVQLLLDVLTEGYFCTSPDGLILQVNRALVHLLGRPLEDLVGSKLERLVAQAPDQRTVSTLVAASASTILAELQLTAASGEPVPVVVCVVSSHVEGERHWLVAPHVGPATGSLPSGDSSQVFLHDLGSALSIAWGFTELLLRRDLTLETERRREMLEIAMRSLQNMRDLLVAARLSQHLQAAETPDTVEQVDLAELMASVLDRLDLGGKIQFLVESTPARQPTLHRQLVGWSMEALLESVLGHSAHGTANVSLGTAGDDLVTITVDDRGTDGTEEAREHDPASSQPNSVAQGRGLGSGLAILSHVARAHGGRAWVEALSEKGARFHLELPSIPLPGSSAEDTCP